MTESTTPIPPGPEPEMNGTLDKPTVQLPGPTASRVPFPTWLEAVLMSVALIVLQLCIGIALAIVFMVIDIIWDHDLTQGFSIISVGNVLAALPLLAWGWWRSGLPLAHVLGFKKVRIAAILAMVPLSLGAGVLLSEIDNLIRVFVPLPNFFEEAFSDLGQYPISGLIALTIIAPWTEEPLFRGLLLGGLARRHRAIPSVLVTAALFSLIHLNPAQMPTAFLIGLLYGWVFLKTQSLWPCIAAHTIHNGLGFLAIYFMSMEIEGYNSDPQQLAFQPLWLDAIALALAGLGILGLIRATRNPNAGTPIEHNELPTVE